MSPKTYAPLLITVYTRLDHLVKCVESFKKNSISNDTDLYVVSDGPFTQSDEIKVQRVREYIRKIDGFQTVTPIFRETNWGSHASVITAMTDLLEEFGKLIVIEDDNIVSPNLLSYLNGGLDFYQSDPKIFSISGYNYPIRMPENYPHDVYAWQGFTGWGVGLWRDRWESIEWDYAGFDSIAKDKAQKRKLDHLAEHLYTAISTDVQRNRKTADTIITFNMYKQGLYSIFPSVSKVRNTGNDGTGEHGGNANLYLQQPIDTGSSFQFIQDIRPDENINRLLRKHFSIRLRWKIYARIARFIPSKYKSVIKKQIMRMDRSNGGESQLKTGKGN